MKNVEVVCVTNLVSIFKEHYGDRGREAIYKLYSVYKSSAGMNPFKSVSSLLHISSEFDFDELDDAYDDEDEEEVAGDVYQFYFGVSAVSLGRSQNTGNVFMERLLQ